MNQLEHALSLNTHGERLVEQGNLTDAIPLFKNAIRAYPDLSQAHINLYELIRNDRNQCDEIIRFLQNLLRDSPKCNTANLHNTLGVLLKADDIFAARTSYERAIRDDPQFATAHKNLGTLLEFQFHEFEDAAISYLNAIRSNPKYARAYYRLAMILLNRFTAESFPLSKLCFQITLSLEPSIFMEDMRFRLYLSFFRFAFPEEAEVAIGALRALTKMKRKRIDLYAFVNAFNDLDPGLRSFVIFVRPRFVTESREKLCERVIWMRSIQIDFPQDVFTLIMQFLFYIN